ncbi:hypothetical protein Y032_0002g612 [Ancylostoma ceylanicum]|uniref:Uncharacterized protein n=1 Tax=Ancylostoma ceylanicum TaxID=53326 RepID=A0A016VZX0_9BILA|nr:hypothetical protein Y032_0002g612 [Ancylostoma ceylanicum]
MCVVGYLCVTKFYDWSVMVIVRPYKRIGVERGDQGEGRVMYNESTEGEGLRQLRTVAKTSCIKSTAA